MAAGIMQHDIDAGLNLPPRLLVTERDVRRGRGTRIIYHLPSSLIAFGTSDADLRLAVKELDAKTEKLVLSVMTRT